MNNMCDESSARLFRPWSNLDSRDESKQIDAPADDDSCKVAIRRKQEEEESCYNIFMIRDKAVEGSSSESVYSPNLLEGLSRKDSEDCGKAESNAEESTTDACPPNHSCLCTADRIRVPFIQDIVHPGLHPMYCYNSFRKLNLPHSSSFDAMMIGASLPIQLETTFPSWINIRKTQFINAFQPSYDVRRDVHAETIDYAVQCLQQQTKGTKKLRSKKFRCEHCNVAFSNNGQLKGHIRIHTGERPFKCDVENCGKAFTRNEELTRHKRIHTGLRPHACLVCGKSFGRKDHLKKHTRTHENRDYRLSAATLGMFSPGHVLPSQGLLFPHYNFPT